MLVQRILNDAEVRELKRPAPQASAEPAEDADPAARSAAAMVSAVKSFVRRALDANNTELLDKFERRIRYLEARLANLERKP